MNDPAANWQSIRELFRVFLGNDVAFRKFIQTCNTKSRESGRLTYAQEERWNSFTNANPEFKSLTFEEVVAAFHVCHIHLKPLRSVEVPIRKDVVSVSRTRESEAQISQAAFYAIPFVVDSPAWGEATHLSVDHCEDCVRRRKQIETGHDHPTAATTGVNPRGRQE
ncbi:hypothetical protein LOC68_01615 [Blastopirellula sp. JC732]|uniref:Uncharacterized protein n=1 Tax=Blastopirellula sediminis TaxID=2894196 RepID=A0A9X1MIU3_9BACT|nr:hypothetical protein [Blastopirellula sediminis]MCC9608115.1 hypothetical protein [Blastopirellula sediminis]MCC9627092.1 hypothetical protein [Blastopirellula sediminis]